MVTMFGSQALETGIGLVLLFFVLSTVASTIVELSSQLIGKRARNLERAIGAILVGTASLDGDERIGRGGARADVNAYLSAFKRTSVWQMAQAGTVRGPR